ncbi:MAG: hypothetical protein KA201_34835, partial [Kofleriaceae bacterium]|nr:hypothetical protein [Kofleriaceae bacterium]
MTRRPALALVTGRPVTITGAPPAVLALVDASLRARGLPSAAAAEPAGLAEAIAADGVVGAWLEAEPAITVGLHEVARAAATAG